jgi:hypothetical protein
MYSIPCQQLKSRSSRLTFPRQKGSYLRRSSPQRPRFYVAVRPLADPLLVCTWVLAMVIASQSLCRDTDKPLSGGESTHLRARAPMRGHLVAPLSSPPRPTSPPSRSPHRRSTGSLEKFSMLRAEGPRRRPEGVNESQ